MKPFITSQSSLTNRKTMALHRNVHFPEPFGTDSTPGPESVNHNVGRLVCEILQADERVLQSFHRSRTIKPSKMNYSVSITRRRSADHR
jgi:hypothetical protein